MASADRVGAHESTRYFAAMALTLVVLIVLTVLPFFFGPEIREFYISEGGPIQVFSAAGYLVVVATLVRELPAGDLKRLWYLMVIPMAMCLRELDFHAHFTTFSVTKTSLYASPDVALGEKLFGLSIFVVLGLALFQLIARHGRAFVQGLRQFDVTAIAIAAAGFSAVASKALDGEGRYLQLLGVRIDALFAAVVVEEVLELGIPVFLVLATFAYFRSRPTRRMLAATPEGQPYRP